MRTSRTTSLLAVLTVLASACTVATSDEGATEGEAQTKSSGGHPHVPNARGASGAAGLPNQAPETSPITLHTGVPMTSTPLHVYYIFYGSAWTSTQKQILTDFGNGIGATSWWGINTSYDDGHGHFVQPGAVLAGSMSVAYPQGKSLDETKIQQIVKDATKSGGALPSDANGVYVVLSDSATTATDFCTKECGHHSKMSANGIDMKYAWVGNGSMCSNKGSCEAQQTSPNGDAAIDGMASVIAHELAETVTDPDIDAWFDKVNGTLFENGDKCAWNFGNTLSETSGAFYNARVGGRHFLLQRNWVNSSAGGYCAQRYDKTFTTPQGLGGTTDAAITGAQLGSKVFAFAKGIGDHGVYVQSWDGVDWSGWSAVPGGLTTLGAMSATTCRDGLYLLATGTDQKIYFNLLPNQGSWAGWQEVPGGGLTDAAPAATCVLGGLNGLHVFVKGLDGHHWENVRAPGSGGAGTWSSWSGWSQLPGGGTTDAPQSAVEIEYGPAEIHLFAKGIGDRQIYENIWTKVAGTWTSGTWGGWHLVPGGGTTDVAVGAASDTASIRLFSHGINDRRIYENDYDASTGTWTGARVIGPWTTDVTPLATVWSPTDDAREKEVVLLTKGIGDKQTYASRRNW